MSAGYTSRTPLFGFIAIEPLNGVLTQPLTLSSLYLLSFTRRTMKNSQLALICGILAMSTANLYAKEQTKGLHWEVDLGLAVGYSQLLIDSLQKQDRELTLTPLAAGGIYYDKFFIESTPMSDRPVTLGYRLIDNETHHLSLIGESLFIEVSESQQERGRKLDGINTRYASLEVGVEYYRAFHDVDVRVSYLVDALDNHNGNYFSTELAWPIFTSRTFLLPSVTLEYLDSKIIDYYLGIDADEATPDRPEYAPNGGWQVGARFYMEHPLNERWSVISALRYTHLSHDISNSPLVSSRNEVYSIQLGILWAF